jgi:flagellar assembly protein FliH
MKVKLKLTEVIQIVLSCRIIKNTSNHLDMEKHLRTLPFTVVNYKEESPLEEFDQTNIRNVIRAEIRREVEEEAARERSAMLEAAALEIGKIKEAAREECARDGYNEGFQRGFMEGKLEAEELRKNAFRLIEDAEKKVSEYFEEYEERILRFAAKIAEKIVHQTIDHHSEDVMLIAKKTLQEYGKAENIIITCNPENADSVKEHFSEIEKLCPNAHVIILEDKSVEKNGLIIENENQITDLQIKKQIERFMELVSS